MRDIASTKEAELNLDCQCPLHDFLNKARSNFIEIPVKGTVRNCSTADSESESDSESDSDS